MKSAFCLSFQLSRFIPLSMPIPHLVIVPEKGVHFRSALLGSRPMPWDLILVGACTALILFVTGAMHFRKTERVFANVA